MPPIDTTNVPNHRFEPSRTCPNQNFVLRLDPSNLQQLHRVLATPISSPEGGPDKYNIHFVHSEDACRETDLLDHLMDNGPLNVGETITIMLQLVSVVSHLHKNNCVHRNIKPDLDMLGSGVEQVQLSFNEFFGRVVSPPNSSDIDLYQPFPMALAIITKGYVAPEMQAKGHMYDAGCDVWALGVVM